MLKTYEVIGYTVNKRGLTVGFNYHISASNAEQAKEKALLACEILHCKYTRITNIAEVTNHDR